MQDNDYFEKKKLRILEKINLRDLYVHISHNVNRARPGGINMGENKPDSRE